MLRTVLHTQELTTYARAWRRLQRAELKAYFAALAHDRAWYFHLADPACEDYRNRYILADAAYTARAGQLARRRADFHHAERQLTALLSAALASQETRTHEDPYTIAARHVSREHADQSDTRRLAPIDGLTRH